MEYYEGTVKRSLYFHKFVDGMNMFGVFSPFFLLRNKVQ